jgi:hypothetical protein
VKILSRRLKSDSCQTHQHKTYRLVPDSAKSHHMPHLTPVAFLATKATTVRTISIFSALHCTYTVRRDGHRPLYTEYTQDVLCGSNKISNSVKAGLLSTSHKSMIPTTSSRYSLKQRNSQLLRFVSIATPVGSSIRKLCRGVSKVGRW